MEGITQAVFDRRVREVLKESAKRTKTSSTASAYADKNENAYLLIGAKKRAVHYSLYLVSDEGKHVVFTLAMCRELELRPLAEDEFVISAWGKMFPGVDINNDSDEAKSFAQKFSGYIITSRFISRL